MVPSMCRGGSLHCEYSLIMMSRPGARGSSWILRRTTSILRRTATVLNGVLDCGFILLGGACHGGKHGHARLRLPSNGSGSFHGHRYGPCDAPTIGAVKSLLSTLPTAAPNGWHSVLAGRDGTARKHVLRGCQSSLVKGH